MHVGVSKKYEVTRRNCISPERIEIRLNSMELLLLYPKPILLMHECIVSMYDLEVCIALLTESAHA